MEVLAPAKINLRLKVLGRRPDGFHEIETFMVPITLADRLELAVCDQPGVRFWCDDASLPTDENNLVVKAAQLFLRETQAALGAEIKLWKRVPHGAGLGGGSSDAAATLIAQNESFGAGLDLDHLTALAAQLGSDVPFFLHRSAAICRGRGELVEPVRFEARLPLLLIKPPFGVPTPWAYQRWRDSVELKEVRYEPQEFDWGTLANDLERPVFEKYIFLARLKQWLLGQPESAGALMSGSGSTMFAVLKSAGDDRTLEARIKAEFGEELWTCTCTTT